MMAGLAAEHGEKKTVMIDATYLKAHRTATSLGVKKGRRGRMIGRTKGGEYQAARHLRQLGPTAEPLCDRRTGQ